MSEEIGEWCCYNCNENCTAPYPGRCPDCSGQGTVQYHGHDVRCAECRGTGYCRICKGQGKIIVRRIKPK